MVAVAETIGFIGCGNMGAALARAAAKIIPAGDIMLANRTPEKAHALADELGARPARNQEVAQACDLVVLGVKPQNLADLFTEIGDTLRARTNRVVLVSMAAGRSIADIRALAGADLPVIRIMPNLPVAIGQGMTLYCASGVTDEELRSFLAAFAAAGQFCELPESLFDAGMAISGCGPAFVFMFLDALAQGGVACGLDEARARELAVQTIIGSAAQVAQSKATPVELTRAVCSPGGTTIEGVYALQRGNFTSTVMQAVQASYDKAAHIAK